MGMPLRRQELWLLTERKNPEMHETQEKTKSVSKAPSWVPEVRLAPVGSGS